MNKLLVKTFIILSVLFTHGLANDYKDIVSIELEKDEHEKILLKYGKTERLFKFRWTLYANGGLVVFRSYDRIVGKIPTVTLRYKLESYFRVFRC